MGETRGPNTTTLPPNSLAAGRSTIWQASIPPAEASPDDHEVGPLRIEHGVKLGGP